MVPGKANEEHDTWMRGRFYEALAELAEGQTSEQQFRRRVLGLLQLINARLDKIRADFAVESDVHPTELLVLILIHLIENKDKIRPTDIQRALGFTAGGVTRRLVSMEKKGLVRRSPDPADGRAWLVSLTDDGAALAVKNIEQNKGRNDKLEAEFSEDEWKTMVNLLDRIAKAIGKQ